MTVDGDPSPAQRITFGVAWIGVGALFAAVAVLLVVFPFTYGDSRYSVWGDLRRLDSNYLPGLVRMARLRAIGAAAMFVACGGWVLASASVLGVGRAGRRYLAAAVALVTLAAFAAVWLHPVRP